MITIFTIPRAFLGEFDRIQRNAIKSWTLLNPEVEVILFGDEEGLTQIAAEYKLLHNPQIKRNEFGTPLINDIFKTAQKIAKNKILAYVNADIILMDDFLKAVKQINFPKFLMVGRRRDFNLKESINFSEDKWQQRLGEQVNKEGKLHGWSGLDYFIFPRMLRWEIPPFAVGRSSFDNWFIYHIRNRGLPVIDATAVTTVVHQNHSCPQKKENFFNAEKKRNLKLAGIFNMMSLRDANWLLDDNDGLKKTPFPRKIFSTLSLFRPWRFALGLKRWLQSRLVDWIAAK